MKSRQQAAFEDGRTCHGVEANWGHGLAGASWKHQALTIAAQMRTKNGSKHAPTRTRRWRENGRRRAAGWRKSGGDKLPGQCDLDGITVLVQDIQPRFGHVARVDCETMIFLAISSRQVICEEPA